MPIASRVHAGARLVASRGRSTLTLDAACERSADVYPNGPCRYSQSTGIVGNRCSICRDHDTDTGLTADLSRGLLRSLLDYGNRGRISSVADDSSLSWLSRKLCEGEIISLLHLTFVGADRDA